MAPHGRLERTYVQCIRYVRPYNLVQLVVIAWGLLSHPNVLKRNMGVKYGNGCLPLGNELDGSILTHLWTMVKGTGFASQEDPYLIRRARFHAETHDTKGKHNQKDALWYGKCIPQDR